MRKVSHIIIFCLIGWQTSAQFNLEFHMGYGKYSSRDLKNYEASLLAGFEGKVLESFPGFWYYGVDAKWNFPSAQIGLSLSEGSTGGQVYYADYSGTFNEQLILKYKAARMLTAARFVFNNGNTAIQADPRIGLAFATLRVTRLINATDGTDSFTRKESSSFKAVNPFCEPTLSISQRLGAFDLNIFAGYHFDLASNFYSKPYGGPLTFNGVAIPMNLSGVRAGGSIGFHLGHTKEVDFTRTYIGIGAGLDFGGIGLNAMSMVAEQVGLFGAIGYNLNKVGLNGGVRLYATKQSARWRPFLSVMYGYNAVYIVKDANVFYRALYSYSRTFYGATIGVGVDLRAWGSNFWTLALQVPFRNDDVKTYKTYLQYSYVQIKRDLLPIAISLGYRFAVKK